MYVYNYVYIDMHSYIERQMETGKNFPHVYTPGVLEVIRLGFPTSE